MKMHKRCVAMMLSMVCLWGMLGAAAASATDLATVHGVVHDPQHFPVSGAQIEMSAVSSELSFHAITDHLGEFDFASVPIGTYRVSIASPGFALLHTTVTIEAGVRAVLHFPLSLGTVQQTVTATPTQTDTVTPTTTVNREQIAETPGADRTLGVAMITDYVPGALMAHDMLHIRGGHQTTWMLDGVAIPNTKIASNVGPQIDPGDIEQLEVDRGSYSAGLGDRTYGVFDVLPRNGFERDRQGDLRVIGGNLGEGEMQLSLGNHTRQTAWYTSLTGSRANYGLQTPVTAIYHDSTNSQSLFASVIRNQTEADQLRFVGQYRQDYFDIPYDPSTTDYETTSGYYTSYGLRDAQKEQDAFLISNWVHTVSPKLTWQVAPFYHFNSANYNSLPTDMPVATTWHQRSNYVGMQTDVHAELPQNSLSGGMYSFYQAENDLFGLQINDGSSASVPNQTSATTAGLVEFYLEDHWRVNQWITLLGGMRFSIFRSQLNEEANYPRIGATARIPRLNWVLRGFYGHYFQPAPVETVSTGLLDYVTHQSGENTFVPLPSERDEEHQFGIQIPEHGWLLDIDNFQTRVNNFLDHSNVGESNLYFPIAVDGALIRGWEMSLHSPQVARRGQFYLTYSNQIAEERGAIIGGFVCSIPTDPSCNIGPAYVPVDHDQRDTLNTGFTLQLPRHSWFSSNVYYGSGLHNGLAGANEGPYNANYLPAHTTFDISGGKSFGEQWRASATIVNVTNHRVLLDNSITVGGFHFNDPRMISGELRYRFHF